VTYKRVTEVCQHQLSFLLTAQYGSYHVYVYVGIPKMWRRWWTCLREHVRQYGPMRYSFTAQSHVQHNLNRCAAVNVA